MGRKEEAEGRPQVEKTPRRARGKNERGDRVRVREAKGRKREEVGNLHMEKERGGVSNKM